MVVAGFSARAGSPTLLIGNYTGDQVTLTAKRNGSAVSINQLGSPLYTIGYNIFVDEDYTMLGNNGDVYQITATNAGGSATGSGTVTITARTFTLQANNATVASGTATTFRLATETSTDAPIATTQVTAGLLPPGLSLDGSVGFVSGTPTAAGSYTITVRFTPAANYTTLTEVFKTITLTVT
jgi:hypothetical protein